MIFLGVILTLYYEYCVLKWILHKKKSISMQLLESQIPPLTTAALRMIICKRPVPLDHHLQEAGTSRSSFARGRPLRMTVCKKLVSPDHHLQEAGPSGSSFARDRPLQMTIYLQEAGLVGLSFARGRPLIFTATKRA